MHIALRLSAVVALLLNAACSTVLEGPTQRISVDTLPTGASCEIKDNDLVLARVNTPGTAEISKSKNDILVECSKEGYIPNRQRNRSDVAISSLGNMVLGQYSFVGTMVDSASGASHKYDSHVFMVMNELPPVAKTLAGNLPEHATLPAGVQPEINLAGLPPEQLALQLSILLNAPKVVVSQQSPGEVMHEVANGEPILPAVPASGADAQQIAGLTLDRVPIQHSAE